LIIVKEQILRLFHISKNNIPTSGATPVYYLMFIINHV
jgi:hypothetical protein